MTTKSEAELIDHVQRRLATKFADLPFAEVTDAVEEAYSHFQGSTVRDYVPLLVEREAGRLLTNPVMRARAN